MSFTLIKKLNITKTASCLVKITALIYVFFLTTVNTLEKTNLDSKESVCLSLIKENKLNTKEFIKAISNNMHILKSDISCLSELIKRGLLKEADHFMLELNKRGIDFKNEVKMATETVVSKVKEIVSNYKYDERDFITVSPAFQWAQNNDFIFIQVKYAHRFDSPGCIEAFKENLTIFDSTNHFVFTAFCVQGETPIKFELDLNLFDSIVEEGSTNNVSSVGRYELNLKKKTKGYWQKLLDPESESPNNMKMWLEMREKYLEYIQKHLDDKDNEEDEKLYEQIRKNKNGEKIEDL